MRTATAVITGLLMLPAGWYALAAANSAIDAAHSSVVATYRQENVPVEASFKRFGGHVEYDPAQPAAARASIEVSTGSLDLGGEDYDAEVRKKEWLDSATYPTATFVSTAIKPGSAGHFEATGTLTLKGRTQTLTVPVTIGKAGAAASFDGDLVISRSFFGIGSKDWDDVLDDKVRIHFHIVE